MANSCGRRFEGKGDYVVGEQGWVGGGGYLPVKFISKPYPLAPHIYAAIDRVERTEKLHSMIRYDVVMIREIRFD